MVEAKDAPQVQRQAEFDNCAVNLAVGKAAVQSSFSQFSHADDPLRAVSGPPNGSFSFHTGHERNPWWLLDLGSICSIDKIVVYNRGDEAQARVRHFRIDIFDPAVGGWKSIYAAEHEFGGLLDDSPLRLNFGAKPKVARFIKLAVQAETSLHLDTVEVFGTTSQHDFEKSLRQSEPIHSPTRAAPTVEPRSLGAIVGLVRGYTDLAKYEALIDRNAAIFETINKGRTTHYPLLIWHEGDISPEHQAHVLARDQNRDVRFIDISEHWKLPLGLAGADMEEHWSVGYRLMCKFNTVDIWDLTRSFDYVLRVDEDCMITRIADDPFQWMHDADLDCAFSWLIDDIHQMTNETLPPFVEAYLAVNNIRSKSVLPLTSCFPYTNVMMGRGDFFRSPRVWHFLMQTVQQRSFYTKRWGDHVVLGVPLNLYSSFNRVQPIKELQYAHDSHKLTVTANDETRARALRRSLLPKGATFSNLPEAEREHRLLECFEAWPINADIRSHLVQSLEKTGHPLVARRLRGNDGLDDRPYGEMMPHITPDLTRYERQGTSQFGEDGVFERLAADLGIEHGTYFEIGIGPKDSVPTAGFEANFIALHERGWKGVFLDGSDYGSEGRAEAERLDVRREFITAFNINHLYKKYDLPEDLDFMSIDVDGQDFWIWMALRFRPKVMCCEYNGGLDKDESKVIQFKLDHRWDYTIYQGCSLKALDKLAKAKCYTLVYANGVNGIFVQDELVGNKDDFDFDRLYRGYHKLGPDPRNQPWVDV